MRIILRCWLKKLALNSFGVYRLISGKPTASLQFSAFAPVDLSINCARPSSGVLGYQLGHTPRQSSVSVHDCIRCHNSAKEITRRYHLTPRYFVTVEMASPGNRMHWDLTTDFIETETDRLISSSKAVYDAVGALSPDAVTYDNVLKVRLFISLSLLSLINCDLVLYIFIDTWGKSILRYTESGMLR